ncbi:SURF1 family protein [Massilia sp. DWR3-1-1]|uniref:SURF1 family protein n=1 Tax=Massilia sp. DWR3-1-1 TaxID=2804559 RepID=UPI003CECC1A3
MPLIVTIVLVLLGVCLGNWQTGRAHQKQALQQRLDAAARQAPLALDGATLAQGAQLEFRAVRLTGQFVDWPLALNNRPLHGQAGFYLVMPFRLADSNTHVLVARGWLPRNVADPASLPPFRTPVGQVTIEGVLKTGLGHIMQLGTPAPLAAGAIVQNLAPAEFASASGLPTLPLILEQTGKQADGLVRDWPAPSLGVDKHQGYAFQWYALAVMAALFFLMTGFRRASKPKQDTEPR